MKPVPIDPKQTALRTPEAAEPQRIDPVPMFNSFLSFSYSSQEMHAVDGQTYVKAKQVRFENGRLQSEQFEGQLPMAMMSAYTQSVFESQRIFTNQTLSVMKLFSAVFALLMKDPRSRN